MSQLRSKLANLQVRSDLLRTLRAFFHDRDFVEVETQLLAAEIIPELHIEPMQIAGSLLLQEHYFLQASPELHMKRLIAAGATAIYQVTRSFRAGERGPLHNPEFTIVEWYRVGVDMQAGMELLDQLAQALLGTPAARRTSYADAFQQHAGVCPFLATLAELTEAAKPFESSDRDELLHAILAKRVEPQLGRDRPEILYHYPASQASLAKVARDAAGHEVAERFELYYRGIELANGFHELTEATEQRRRFEAVNAARLADGRPALPLPESLLAALECGLPNCTGCALGFDRVVMLAVNAATIEDVVGFRFSPREANFTSYP